MALSIERIETLLLIAAIVAMLARRWEMPYTVGLTLGGIALALFHLAPDIRLTKDLIFTAFLPPLIFEAAFQIRWPALRRDLGLILVLATVGVLLAAGLTAIGLRLVAGWPWIVSLLLGVLISATDPVSVIATFKDLRVSPRLQLLVEAESLLNDGTVAVLFSVTVAAMSGGAVSVPGIAWSFVITVLGGVLCGALAGGGALLLVGHTDDHLVEISFTSVAAYGSFLLAEHFHLSGVLATLTAGIVIGNVGWFGTLSGRGREAVESFWEYVGFMANSLIFLLIGIHLTHQNFAAVWLPALALIVLVTLGRALTVYGCCALFKHSAQQVPLSQQHILFWGGLRGALALALVLGLPSTMPQREAVITVAFAVVAFSVIAQGMTIPPLLVRLGESEAKDIVAK